MIIYDCEQRSPEWLRLRIGKITGSQADRLTTPAKLKTYQYAVLAELISGVLEEHYVSEPMQWGIDQEPHAIDWYRQETGYKIQRVGFCQHDEMRIAGCSPDLLVMDDGLAQFKCPTSKNHMKYFCEGPDADVIYQMQFEMLVTGRQWSDFVTYDPRMPHGFKGMIQRVERDEKIIAKLTAGILEIDSFIDNFMLTHGAQPFEFAPEEQEIDDGFF